MSLPIGGFPMASCRKGGSDKALGRVLLKQAKDFEIIGKSVKRLDTPEKTSGKAVFGIDVKIPGMLTAVIARPPVFGGRVKSLNAEKTKAVPGVREVVEIDFGVAVVADSFCRQSSAVRPWRLPGTMAPMPASRPPACANSTQAWLEPLVRLQEKRRSGTGIPEGNETDQCRV